MTRRAGVIIYHRHHRIESQRGVTCLILALKYASTLLFNAIKYGASRRTSLSDLLRRKDDRRRSSRAALADAMVALCSLSSRLFQPPWMIGEHPECFIASDAKRASTRRISTSRKSPVGARRPSCSPAPRPGASPPKSPNFLGVASQAAWIRVRGLITGTDSAHH
jgi:hypothetical protein